MKNVYALAMLVTAVCMLLFPLSASGKGKKTVQANAVPGVVLKGEDEDVLTEVRVKLADTGEIRIFSLEDYIFGVVAAEMPALYENEALKAQAVVGYTYFLRKKDTSANTEYDISDDYTVDQAFITPEKARERWGDGADEYEQKIKAAVKEVLYKKVTYGGDIAVTVYHAISGGKTERAADIWGGEYPYLVQVDSSWDKLAENYLSTAEFTADELKSKLSALAELKSTDENCFSDISRTDSGSVKNLKISGVTVSGGDLRKALNLRSADFDISFSDKRYVFTVRGYGHGIGMSQNGANYMAMQGKTWEEILLHYYPGCKIE